MKETRIKTHALLIMAVSITILHFILTSVVGYYIATQIGTSTGQVVAKGLIESTENAKSPGREVNEIYQDMKTKSDEIISSWKIPMLLISLPIKALIQPLLNRIRKAWIYEPILSKKISKEQLKIRGIIIENIANGLNSFTLGALIYLACRLISKGRSTTSK